MMKTKRVRLCAGVLLLAGLSGICARAIAAQAPAGKSGAATAQKVSNPLNDLLDEAQAAIERKDYNAAVAPLQKFLQEKPDVAYAHFQLAYAYTGLQRADEARAEYERAIALDAKMAEAYLNLGMLLLNGNSAAAVAPLKKAVELLPAQSRPRYLLGLAQERAGDVAGAAESFEAAATLDPGDAEVKLHLATMLLHAGKPAEAEKRYRAVLEKDAHSPEALRGLAESLAAEKKPEAADAFRAYLEVKPNDVAARTDLIHLLLDAKQNDEAMAELEKASADRPMTSELLLLRADILVAQKKIPDAIASVQKALQLAPNDAQLRGGLGRLYMQERDFAAAERELKQAIQLDSKLVYWKDLSSTYYLAGNCQATLATLDVIGKAERATPGTVFLHALCYDKLGQVQQALEAYRKFIELDQNRNADQVWQANQRIHVLEKETPKKK